MSLIANFETYLLTEKRVAKNSFDAYKSDLAQFDAFLKKQNTSLEQATIEHIKLYLSVLKKNGIAARSMSRKISSLKAFYNYSERVAGLENPTKDILFPKLEKTLPRFLTEAEIENLFCSLEQDTTVHSLRNKLLVHLLYVSGMRITELTQIKLSDIQHSTGFIMIHGKGNKQRLVPLPQQTFDLIRTYCEHVLSQFQKKHTQHVDFLFPTLYAGKIKPISRQLCWSLLRKLCKESGITRNISPHQLRHSLATHLLKKGADLRSLQLWLGHEHLTTVQVYTHVETSFLREVYDKKHPRS